MYRYAGKISVSYDPFNIFVCFFVIEFVTAHAHRAARSLRFGIGRFTTEAEVVNRSEGLELLVIFVFGHCGIVVIIDSPDVKGEILICFCCGALQ